MKRAYQRHLDGMAGVYAVAEQLCKRGHTSLFPAVDFGFDMALDNGLKIQVKCGRLRIHPGYVSGVYCFDVRKVSRIENYKIVTHDRNRTYEDVADFVIFFGMDERRFFIVPANAIDRAVWIPSKLTILQRVGKGRVAKVTGKMGIGAEVVLKYEDAWGQLDMPSVIESLEQVLVAEGDCNAHYA